MKKLFLSAIAAAALFSACSSDDVVDSVTPGEGGELRAVITFQGVNSQTRAADSKYVPKTTWANIEDMRIFLYNASGVIAGTAEVTVPTSGTTATASVTGVAPGTYDVVVVANSKQPVVATDGNISTYSNGALSAWTSSLKGKNIANTYLGLYDITTSAPTGWNADGTTVAYQQPTEVFVARQTGVTIVANQTASPTSSLALKREVSLMRVRIDNKTPIEGDAKNINENVQFNSEQGGVPNILTIGKQPAKAYSFATSTFEGGIVDNAKFDATSAILAASGSNIYQTTDPTTPGIGTGNTVLTGNYAYYRDIVVLPNMSKKDIAAEIGVSVANIDASAALLEKAEATKENQYWITVAGVAPIGYVMKDVVTNAETTLTAPRVVYFSGRVKTIFAPNFIREVNLKVVGAGYNKPLPEQETGNLDITVEAPIEWNKNILEETVVIQ